MQINEDDLHVYVWDAITELPIEYKVGEKIYYLYPPSLGSTLLINRANKRDRENREDIIYEMLAICSFERRKDACKPSLLNKRIEELKRASVNELMPIYTMFSEWGNDQDKFTKLFNLDVEQRYMKRARDVKGSDSSSLVFNGKSMYGALIDVACERYGWSMNYVVWGISMLNLNMLMEDKVVSVYLTKEESKKAAIPQNRNIIKVDKNMSKEELLAFLNR
jgi:hypothetical protein